MDDLRELARRRLPAGVFDYVDGGADDELTLRRNIAAFHDVEFTPRVFRDVAAVDTSTTLLGRSIPAPLLLAPTGFTRIVDSQGELAVARAAARAGLPYALSIMATRSIEEVAEVSNGPKWLQISSWHDRSLVEDLLQRACDSGYEAVALGVDTPVLGRRERDVRRGFTLPPAVGLSTIIDGLRHPGWTWEFLRGEPITFSAVADRAGASAVSLGQYLNSQFDASVSWSEVEWLRSVWNGPVVLKGIQSVADAELARDHGVDAIVLSNHGGRQLDGSPPILELIEPVAQAVGGDLDIVADGGVRRGSDIVKAVALGATAVGVGRAYLYGLAAGGESGVDHVLGLLTDGMRRTMALTGCGSIDDIPADVVSWRNGR